jgi:hypothetical protein
VPVPAARLALSGCVLLAALLLAACGGGGTDPTPGATAASSSTTVREKPRPRPVRASATPGGPCQAQLGSFVASMDSLRRRLAVGVTLDQYRAEVRGIRSTYRQIPVDRVELDCLGAIGTPSEKAFNRYIEAANDWGECVSEAGCGSATVEPMLQRRWRSASRFLSEADAGLRADAP